MKIVKNENYENKKIREGERKEKKKGRKKERM